MRDTTDPTGGRTTPANEIAADEPLGPLEPSPWASEHAGDDMREGRLRDLKGAEGTSVASGDGSAADIGTADTARRDNDAAELRAADRSAGPSLNQGDYQRTTGAG
jgi:hypothetical protein